MFIVQKDNGVIPHVLTQILDSCVNGVTLTDPDLEDAPIVYANKAFEDILRRKLLAATAVFYRDKTGSNRRSINCERPLKKVKRLK